MPDFSKALEERESSKPSDFGKLMQAEERAQIREFEDRLGPPKPFVPQCHVCTHEFRDWIDLVIAKGSLSYSEISRRVPPGKNGRHLDRRSIANHAKQHLGVGDHAIRVILEEQAEREMQDYVEDVRGAVTHRGALEVAFRKSLEDVINGVATVEPRDMIKIAETLRKWDTETNQTQVETLKAQVSALIGAIKKVLADQPDDWARIITEYKRAMGVSGVADMGPGEGEIVDATVVPDEQQRVLAR